jgi:hypothetical protein
LGASEAKRRDGAGEELRRDRRTLKAEAEGGEGHAAAASKQRRKKPRASGGDTSSGGRSKSSSRGATASDSEAARSAAAPGAEDDRNGYWGVWSEGVVLCYAIASGFLAAREWDWIGTLYMEEAFQIWNLYGSLKNLGDLGLFFFFFTFFLSMFRHHVTNLERHSWARKTK